MAVVKKYGDYIEEESDESVESEFEEIPPAKKAHVTQRFKSDYSVRFPVITKSNVSEGHAYCNMCMCDFSVSHGGIVDVKKHVNTAKHTSKSSLQSGTRKLPDFFAGNKDLSVIRAEALFTEFVVEHNLPVACSDHAGPLFRKMFPDSAIGKKYGCGRTKTEREIY